MSDATRYGATPAELAGVLTELGEPAYRVRQVLEGLWTQRKPLDALTNVPRALRDLLGERFPLALTPVTRHRSDAGTTTKWLFRGADGAEVETVLMEYPDRATVCVSSQAGCAMRCSFCATGQGGFERHLDAGEIVEQVLVAQHSSARRVSNVVFMGMGEPLANVEPVLASLARLHADLGISARHLTVSTVGVVPGIHRLREFPLPVRLAVSVHAADDVLRDRLVPLNRTYPLSEVLDAAREYAAVTGRRVTFEYAVIGGVNDTVTQAARLAERLRGFRGGAHVNLIALNPTAGYPGAAPAPDRLEAFARELSGRGVTATVRANRGVEIDAACGQLRTRTSVARRSVTMES